jgi:hypothetical protein
MAMCNRSILRKHLHRLLTTRANYFLISLHFESASD